MLAMIQNVGLFVKNAGTQQQRTFFRGEGFDESGAGNAGIQGFDTHAPRWNTLEMCVRIKQFPSALCVFSAGTQYFLKENSARENTGIQ